MEKHKVLITLSAIFLLASNVSAVVPGEGFEATEKYNDTVLNVTTDESSLFETEIVNKSQVNVDVTGLEAKGDYVFDVALNNTSNNDSFYMENFTLTVDEYNNYMLRPSNISQNLSIGSSGQLQQVMIDGRGNSVQEVDLNVSGNVSDFVTLLDTDKFVPVNGSRPVNLVYDIPRNKDFGNYNGSLVVNTSDRSRNVSLNLSLVDEINPEFESSNVSDFMATNPQTFSVDVSDNLKVVNASAKIVREYSKVVNETTNETELVNETISEALMNRSSDNYQRWLYDFKDVDTIGDYYVTFNISDESNNSANMTKGFRVQGLDSITVLNNDFEFKDSRPRNEEDPSRLIEKEVFSKSSDKELDLYLSDLDFGENNSVYIGIRNEDMSNTKDLYSDGQMNNLTLTDPGEYSLVVYSSDEGFSYEGALNLRPVSQHVEIDERILFKGAFVDPEFPELPGERSLGSFSGRMEFVTNDNGVPVGLVYEGQQMDISDCKGADSWSNCLPGYTLGEIPDVRQKADDAIFAKNIAYAAMGVSWFFVIFMIFNGYAEGFSVRTKEVPKSEVGDVVGRNEELAM